MHVTARVDYAVRALVELAAREAAAGAPVPVPAEQLATAQELPVGFLRGILADLRRAGLIASQQGTAGGFRLARAADGLSLAEVIRAVEGPIAQVRGLPPHELEYPGTAAPLRDVWVAVRANLRAVLDHTTVADVASGHLPEVVTDLVSDPAAWEARPRA
ncbi:MAG: RrF2 family transcriptional regulator [Microthrixaceae bacterium]